MAELTRNSMVETDSSGVHKDIAEGEKSDEDDVFADGLSESLANALECPVCLEYMIPPICLCENGHNVCSVCRPKLSECPSCRRPFLSSTRNVALESITAGLEYPCRNDGCFEVLPLDLVLQHQQVCPYKPYDCPLALRTCSWKGPRAVIRKHVLETHKKYARIGSESTNILKGVTSASSYSLVIFAFDQVFLQRSSMKNSKFYSSVQLVAPQEEAMQYRYEFEVCSDDGSQRVLIGNLVHSDAENLQEIIRVGKCVMLDSEVIKNFMYDRKLPYKLRIFQVDNFSKGSGTCSSS